MIKIEIGKRENVLRNEMEGSIETLIKELIIINMTTIERLEPKDKYLRSLMICDLFFKCLEFGEVEILEGDEEVILKELERILNNKKNKNNSNKSNLITIKDYLENFKTREGKENE